jgi:hypothetical protein
LKEEDNIVYRISAPGSAALEYSLNFDENFDVVVEERDAQDWALLENCQCPNCPYDKADKEYCPVALAISPVLFSVDGAESTEVVECQVLTSERQYLGHIPYQRAIYSLVGLLMATSGCSRFGFLKPMARFHLPFADLEETIARNSGFFLFAGYFEKPDESLANRLEQLTQHYRELVEVNQALLLRVRGALKKGDVHRNAMIVLSSFSQVLGMDAQRSSQVVEKLFNLKRPT